MAKKSSTNTQPARANGAASAPAPETTQQHAGAGESQGADNNGEPTVVALLITSQVEGFRRAGRAWGKTQTRVEIDDLTEQEVIALFDEPMLEVVGVAE